MRRIKESAEYTSDRRALLAADATLAAELDRVVALLAKDAVLHRKYKDHALRGRRTGFRDCHVRPDIVLVYSTAVDGLLELVRLGSHSEVFG